MTRTIVTLPEDDKQWLDNYSHLQRISVAELIRRAIHNYRRLLQKDPHREMLKATAGLWHSKKTDGLKYVEKLRSEWGK